MSSKRRKRDGIKNPNQPLLWLSLLGNFHLEALIGKTNLVANHHSPIVVCWSPVTSHRVSKSWDSPCQTRIHDPRSSRSNTSHDITSHVSHRSTPASTSIKVPTRILTAKSTASISCTSRPLSNDMTRHTTCLNHHNLTTMVHVVTSCDSTYHGVTQSHCTTAITSKHKHGPDKVRTARLTNLIKIFRPHVICRSTNRYDNGSCLHRTNHLIQPIALGARNDNLN